MVDSWVGMDVSGGLVDYLVGNATVIQLDKWWAWG